MPLLGFNESTIALLLIFAFFVIAIYSIIKLAFKVAMIAIISMAFPVALNYFGLYEKLGVDTILVFGILGSMFYLVYFFVDMALGVVWPMTGFFTKKNEQKTKRQRKKQKKDDEYEIQE